jgi:hypothetical protein
VSSSGVKSIFQLIRLSVWLYIFVVAIATRTTTTKNHPKGLKTYIKIEREFFRPNKICEFFRTKMIAFILIGKDVNEIGGIGIICNMFFFVGF